SMDAFATELQGCLGAADGSGAEEQTVVVSPPRRRRQRAPSGERPSIWPLILLLAGLAVLAGIFAAVFALTGSPTKFIDKVGGGGGGGSSPVHLNGVTAYDPPPGDGEEHSDETGNAT